MQINANSTSYIPGNSLPTAKVDAPVIPDASSNTSPSVSLTFTVPNKVPDTYDQPYVDVIQVRNQDKGAAATRINQSLISDLGNIRSGKTTFSTSNIFSKIGSLSRETNDYSNQARGLRMASTKVNDKTALDFNSPAGRTNQTVKLSIKTKDGDIIDIKLQHNEGALESLEFSFSVTGKLSKEEQEALDKLATKLGEVADEFFRNGNTQLRGLKEFDDAQLESFHIEFTRPKDDAYVTMNYDYRVDNKARHLTANDIDGYSLDISSDLELMGNAGKGIYSLQSYIQLISKVFNEHQPLKGSISNQPNIQFLIDAFTSMVDPQGAKPAPFSTDSMNAHVDNFTTGLPDFNASLTAPLFQDHTNFLFPEAQSVKLSQKTISEVTSNGRMLMKQTQSYERNRSAIEGIVGSNKGDLETGNFIFHRLHEKRETSRIMDMGIQGLSNLIIEHKNSREESFATYLNFHLQDSSTEKLEGRTLKQLAGEIQKHKDQKQSFDPLHALNESSKKLFAEFADFSAKELQQSRLIK